MTGTDTLVRGVCPHDCPDTCAWLVIVEHGVATSVVGDPDHPFTEGALCSKLKHYEQRTYSKDRVLYPHRRVGPKGAGKFERISWETAIDEISTRMREISATDGPLAIMPHNFAGTIGLLHRYAGDPFFARLGATGVHRDICGSVASEGVATTQGTVGGMVPEDLIHSKLILIWGTNTVTTNLHLWSAVIRKARAQGTKVIAIDPIRTAAAASADQHIQLRPGTDAALALGLMHVIVKEHLFDADYVSAHTVGFDALRERVSTFTPEKVVDITGVPAEDIISLARTYANTYPAAIRLSVGMERRHNGYSLFRAVSCLPGLTGAWQHQGGGILQFTGGLMFDGLDYGAILPPDDWPQPERFVHLAQLGKALTDPAMTPAIKLLMVFNSNPLVTAPQQNLMQEGLVREDLCTVVHEQFITDTAMYADYLLPATTQLEHLELMPSWGTAYVALNPPAIEPRGEAISNTELFRRLSQALGFTDELLLSSDEERIRQMLSSGSPYVEGITYESLLESGWARLNLPEPFQPLGAGQFPTPSGKLEFYSETRKEQGHDPLPAYEHNETVGGYPLNLIAAKGSHFLNSEYVNLQEQRKVRTPIVTLHPEDAKARAITDGENVRVFNDNGELTLCANVSTDAPPGVVSIPFGWWRDSTGGDCPNALTPDGVSNIGIGSNAFDATVEVAAVSTS